MGYPHRNDSTLRYDLYFSKYSNEQHVSGNFVFVGETLELEQFHYQPIHSKDALFPAKYSKEQAQKFADAFIKKFDHAGYELEKNDYNQLATSILTQPVQYTFTYVKKKAGIPISDQTMSVSVLGDGTVTSFYNQRQENATVTYDEPAKALDESDVKKKMLDNLKAQLSYRVDTNYTTGDSTVKLIYNPNYQLLTGVHALSGQWLTPDGLSQSLTAKKITPIVSNPLPARQPNLTPEQAQAIAEKLLATDRKDVTLSISSVEETTEAGKAIYSIHYMYQYRNGGSGTTLKIDKATGEVIDYSDVVTHMVEQEVDREKEPKLSKQQAIDKAVAHVKEWIPSYAHQYALPINNVWHESYNNTYYISFPRVVNGLTVEGDEISINVDAETGALVWLRVNAYDHLQWPAVSDVITEQEATTLLKDQLKLKLQYVNHEKVEGKEHYSLVYAPVFNDGLYPVIDAKTGEWFDASGAAGANKPKIAHPTAAEELNYLIQAGILEADATFNADRPVTKEEALKILLKSVTYMYYGSSPYDSDMTNPSFTDIAQDDELYTFVARGLKMGMLDKTSTTFNAKSSLSNQELAKWLVGALKLNNPAQLSDIYQLNYSDAAQVDPKLRGHVALAYGLGLLEAKNNELKPTSDVTYAQLAQVTIRLAHKMNEYQISNY